MNKTRVDDLVRVREAHIRKNGWNVTTEGPHGLRRITLSDGSAQVDVWLTTGSWNVIGSDKFRRNDWAGFLRYMAVME